MKHQNINTLTRGMTESNAITSEIDIRTKTKVECSETCQPIIEEVCASSDEGKLLRYCY